jgi:prepilin peptidase CpaA
VWAAACGAYDLVVRRLPNALTLGAHGGALAMLAATGQGWLGASPSSCFAAWTLALVLTMPGYVFKLLGAGDVKLLAAMGLAGGLEAMLIAHAVAGLLVGGAAIVWMLAYRWEPLLAAPLARIGINFPAVPGTEIQDIALRPRARHRLYRCAGFSWRRVRVGCRFCPFNLMGENAIYCSSSLTEAS